MSSCAPFVRGATRLASNSALLIDFNIDTNGMVTVTAGSEFATPIINASLTGSHVLNESDSEEKFHVVFNSTQQVFVYEVDTHGQPVVIQAENENVALHINGNTIDVIVHGPSILRIENIPVPQTPVEISSPLEVESIQNASVAAVLRTVPSLNLRSGPGVEHNILTVLPSEAPLTLLDQVKFANDGGMWCKVQYGQTVGWVNRAYIWVRGVNEP
jgi:hypothetical protein